MVDMTSHEKANQGNLAGSIAASDMAGNTGFAAAVSSVAGTWVNKDNLAYSQFLIHTIRFDDREGEVSMDCTIGQNREKFFGFYYAWPNDRFYLVLQKAENGLQEHYMFVSLRRDSQSGVSALLADMTGSIEYTRM